MDPLARVRLQHAEENTADYLEALADLIAERGEARLVDLAARLGVSQATANRKVAQLQRANLVRTEPYKAIHLQPDGAAAAAESKRRHTVVLHFLRAAGVSEEDAQRDAEGIEHHVSPQTLEAFARLTTLLAAAAPSPTHSAKRRPPKR